MKKGKKRKSAIESNMKDEWLDVPQYDFMHWLGQYLMAAMVLNAWDKKLGSPRRVGKIEDMVETKGGGGTIAFQAQWDD